MGTRVSPSVSDQDMGHLGPQQCDSKGVKGSRDSKGHTEWVQENIKMRCPYKTSEDTENEDCHHQPIKLPQRNQKADRPSTELRYAVPTNAFGEIKFVGLGGHTAKFVRVDKKSSKSKILELMRDKWGLEKPKLVISVTGGAKDFNMKPRLRDLFRYGLMKAVQSTDAWIITGGTYTGVMKHVGEAVKEYNLTSTKNKSANVIGIAPWGVIQNRHDLENNQGSWPVKYIIKEQQDKDGSFLDPNHSHFILVDNGTQQKYGTEISFRAELERKISEMQTGTGADTASVPVVLLVLEGGHGTLKTVKTALEENTPAVIVKGSGRAADILAYAFKYAETVEVDAKDNNGVGIKIIKKQMKQKLKDDIAKQMEGMKFCEENKIPFNIEQIQHCLDKAELIQIFEWNSSTIAQDIDDAILKALLKAKKGQVMDQLKLALAFNRVDVAKSDILHDDIRWKREKFDDIMFSAIEKNRVDFVELFLDIGINLKKFLTIRRLQQLYNNVPSGSIYINLLDKMHQERNYSSMDNVGYLIQHLLGDYYLPYYISKNWKDRFNQEEVVIEDATEDVTEEDATEDVTEEDATEDVTEEDATEDVTEEDATEEDATEDVTEEDATEEDATEDVTEEDVTEEDATQEDATTFSQIHDFINPERELFIWSVLNNYQEMAKLFWLHGKDATAAALVAHALLTGMSKKTDDMALRAQITANASEFTDLAIGVLKECYKKDYKKAQQMLIRRLTHWGNATCIEIAVNTKNKWFISQDACHDLFNSIWMGDMTQENHTLKLLLCITIPPLILLLVNFKKKENGELAGEDQPSSNVQMKKMSKLPVPYPRGKTNMSLEQSHCALHEQETKDDSKDETEGDVKHLNFKKFSSFYRAPVVIYIFYVIYYILFLVVYSYELLITKFEEKISLVEAILLMWMITIFLDEFMHVKNKQYQTSSQKIRSYMTDGWNRLEVSSLCLLFIGTVLRVTYIYQPIVLEVARIFFAFSLVVFFLKLLHIFSWTENLGPKLMLLIHMAYYTIYFLLILGVFIVGYGIASHAILYPNTELSLNTVIAIFRRPYWNIYGELMLDEIEGAVGCTDNAELYGNGTSPRCPSMLGKYYVSVLMGAYMMSTILLMNVLFSYTFEMVQGSSIQEYWCLHRYKLIEKYRHRYLPPPLNIYVYIYLLVRKCLSAPIGNDSSKDSSKEHELRQWEDVIADAFHHTRELTKLECSDYRVNTAALQVDQLVNKIDELQDKLQAVTETSSEKKLKNIETQLQQIMHHLGIGQADHKITDVQV